MEEIKKLAFQEFIEQLDGYTYHAGYEVSGTMSDDGSVSLTVRCIEDRKEKYPELSYEFKTYQEKGGDILWYVIPTLKFPELTYDIENDYWDDIAHWTKEWASIGTAISSINKWDFNYTGWVEEYEFDHPVESCTDITAAREVVIENGDEEIVYADPDGVMGDPGDEISLADIKGYWNSMNDDDPCLTEYATFDEWWAETRKWLKDI